jgi:hypothetical protein
MINYIKRNWKTSLGAFLALVGLGLFWADYITKEQFEGGLAIVVIYIGAVAADAKKS